MCHCKEYMSGIQYINQSFFPSLPSPCHSFAPTNSAVVVAVITKNVTERTLVSQTESLWSERQVKVRSRARSQSLIASLGVN